MQCRCAAVGKKLQETDYGKNKIVRYFHEKLTETGGNGGRLF